jgi:hypothetical protein
MGDDKECPDCGGCGEVQCINLGEDGHDEDLPCPTCGAQEHAEKETELKAEIATLKARVEELEAVLKPFVDLFNAKRDGYVKRHSDPALGLANFNKLPGHWVVERADFDMDTFRRAAAALEAK